MFNKEALIKALIIESRDERVAVAPPIPSMRMAESAMAAYPISEHHTIFRGRITLNTEATAPSCAPDEYIREQMAENLIWSLRQVADNKAFDEAIAELYAVSSQSNEYWTIRAIREIADKLRRIVKNGTK